MSAKQLTWAVRQMPATMAEKLVLIVLADRADSEGWSFYSQQTIADKARCTRKTAREALKRLEDAGLIRRAQRSIGKLRTSDHIQIGPSSRWVEITQPPGSILPTIPSSPYGVEKGIERKGARRDAACGLRLVHSAGDR